MADEFAASSSVEVEKVGLWSRRLLTILSPPCNLLGHEILFTSAHFRLTGCGSVVVGDINVSLRINWLHDCFRTDDMTGAPLSGHKRKEFYFNCPLNFVPEVLQALSHCSTLTHARFSFSGYDPLAVERLLFPLCQELRSTRTLSSLRIEISFPFLKPDGSMNDATIRRFSPILLVRNHSLKTLLIHSDCHNFDGEAAEEIMGFVRDNGVLESLDLLLPVTSPGMMVDNLWVLMRPLSDADTFGYPSRKPVANKKLRNLVLKFIVCNPDWRRHLDGIKHRDALVNPSFFMCPLLHNLSLSLVSLNVHEGTEVVHVAVETRCSDGHKELHILKCDESDFVFDGKDDMWVLNLDSIVWRTFRYANADVLVLQNPSAAAVRHYIPIYRDSYCGPVRTIKLSSTAKDEDVALQRACLGALVSSILTIEGPRKLHVEMRHRYLSLISAAKNSKDTLCMWKLLRDLRGSTCLQSLVVDKFELRRVDGVLRPLFAGAFLGSKSVEVTEVYEVKVKISSR